MESVSRKRSPYYNNKKGGTCTIWDLLFGQSHLTTYLEVYIGTFCGHPCDLLKSELQTASIFGNLPSGVLSGSDTKGLLY